ncbi:hypothetical protein EDB83DRAFT_1525961 [Lactarius deliciosus]|nr:hypothetical protein EDB83DRAFT_1525961 [Lactarius deliciosus]
MASLHFCSECNNLLYPKAEQQRRTMVYACRICPSVDETVDNGLVYRNDLLNVTKEQAGVTTDLGQDPTLAHTNIACPNCGHEEYVLTLMHYGNTTVLLPSPPVPSAVFYQDQSKRKETRMILFYVCTRCNHNFQDKLGSDGQPAESNPT